MRNDNIRERLKVEDITERCRKARLRWFGRYQAYCGRQTLEMVPHERRRGGGRPKQRWMAMTSMLTEMRELSAQDHAAPSFLVAFVTRQLHQTSAGLRATLATSGITPPAYTCQQTPTNRSTTSPGTAHHAASLNSQPASLTLLPQ